MYANILVPTDGSRATRAALEHALDIARRYDATLHALYVVDSSVYPRLDAGSEMVLGSLEEEGQNAVASIVEAAERTGVEVTTAVEDGTVHEAILDYADSREVDLIVMATHGRSGIDRYLLGSTTEKVVRASPVPVLTVRGDGDADDPDDAEGEARPI